MLLLRVLIVAALGLAVALSGAAVPASAEEPAPADPAEDVTYVVTDDGAVYAEDEWHSVPGEDGHAEETAADDVETSMTEPVASYSLEETFALHSRPGAQRTIYLDFDGGTLGSDNMWLRDGMSSLNYPAWSVEGTSATFSSSERLLVQEVWARMADDFAPFNVDVTTQEPAHGALFRSTTSDAVYGTRVAFTSGTSVQQVVCSGGCGGVAWVGTYDSVTNGETRSPAWVFPSSLGNRAKNLAEAASHEVGHTLGLGHDGTTTSPYYGGGPLWGPIMGAPYSSAVTQWSRGDYISAGNHEDDYSKILSNGLALRADEAGDSAVTAAPLVLPGGRGVLTSALDQDWYALTDCTGTVTARVDPAAVGPNVDLRIEVRDAAGNLMRTAAPATSRTTTGVTGLSASLTVSFSSPSHYIVVSGAGSGAGGTSGWASGGYDAYGSVGSYRINVSGCATTPPAPLVDAEQPQDPTAYEPAPATRPGTVPRPRAVPGPLGGYRTLTARWYAPASNGGAPINGYQVFAHRLDGYGRIVETRSTTRLASTARAYRFRLPRARWVVRVRASNRVGWGALSTRSLPAVPR